MALTKDQGEAIAEIVVTVSQIMSFIPIETWEEAYKALREEYGRYSAIGIMEGISYLEKVKKRKAELERMEKFMALRRIFEEQSGGGGDRSEKNGQEGDIRKD